MKKTNLADTIRQAGQRLADLLFPAHCAVCQRSGYILCTTCQAKIQPSALPRCQHCHAQLTPEGLCKSCYYHPLQISGLRTISSYEEPLRTCIHALKYQGNQRLAEPLGRLLAQAYKSYHLQADWLTAVPLHKERQQQRGYNHAALLAHVCAAQIGLPVREDVIIRQRLTVPQVDLQMQDRLSNVKGAFACLSETSVLGHKILIIDDVSTTGATIEACAAPLLAAGALSVWGLVLARSA